MNKRALLLGGTLLACGCGTVTTPEGDAAGPHDASVDGPAIDGPGTPPIRLSADGGGQWRYRRSIPIIGSSGGTQHLYAVLLTVDTASLVLQGHMQASGEDLRFVGGDRSELPWWIESGMNTAATRIWVRVDDIPVDGTTIELYYGNPNATLTAPHLHSGAATFLMFDDFASPGLSAARWSVGQRYRLPEQQGGLLHFFECCSSLDGEEVQTVASFTGSKVAEVNLTMGITPVESWKSEQFRARIGPPEDAYSAPYAYGASGWWSNGVQDCAAVNGTYLARLVVDVQAGSFVMALGGVECARKMIGGLGNPYVFNFTVEGGGGSATVDFHDVRVRPYVSPEPTAETPWAEEEI